MTPEQERARDEAWHVAKLKIFDGASSTEYEYARAGWDAAWSAATAAERERCAKVCEQWSKDERTASSFGADNYSYTALDDVAAAIRTGDAE